MLSKQKTFNIVKKHLLTQKKRAMVKGECYYRLGELKCAVGCLIPDKEYKEEFEGRAPENIPYLAKRFDTDFLFDLLYLHDNTKPYRWPSKLRALAKEHNLAY